MASIVSIAARATAVLAQARAAGSRLWSIGPLAVAAAANITMRALAREDLGRRGRRQPAPVPVVVHSRALYDLHPGRR